MYSKVVIAKPWSVMVAQSTPKAKDVILNIQSTSKMRSWGSKTLLFEVSQHKQALEHEVFGLVDVQGKNLSDRCSAVCFQRH